MVKPKAEQLGTYGTSVAATAATPKRLLIAKASLKLVLDTKERLKLFLVARSLFDSKSQSKV